LTGCQACRAGWARKLAVKVDDEIVATLRPGERRSVEIGAGRHVVQAKMDWCTSPQLPIDLAGDESLTVEIMFPFNMKSLFKAYVRPRTSIVARVVSSPEF
jgi:hypothetical protein